MHVHLHAPEFDDKKYFKYLTSKYQDSPKGWFTNFSDQIYDLNGEDRKFAKSGIDADKFVCGYSINFIVNWLNIWSFLEKLLDQWKSILNK